MSYVILSIRSTWPAVRTLSRHKGTHTLWHTHTHEYYKQAGDGNWGRHIHRVPVKMHEPRDPSSTLLPGAPSQLGGAVWGSSNTCYLSSTQNPKWDRDPGLGEK